MRGAEKDAGVENKKYPLYLFDTDFDAVARPPEPAEVEDEPPPPTFSTEELQAARDAAFEAGKAEGVAQSNAGFEQQISAAVAAVQERLADVPAAQREANEATMRAAVAIAATIGRKLFPAYARRHGLAEIEAFVESTLATLFTEAEVVVKAPEALAAELERRLAPAAAATGLGDGLKIVADPALGPADCQLEWGNGGAARSGDQVLSQVDALVARFLEHRDAPPDDGPGAPAEDAADAAAIAAQDDADESTAETTAPQNDFPAPDPTAHAEDRAAAAPAGAEAPAALPAEPAMPKPPPAPPPVVDTPGADAARTPQPTPAPAVLPGAIGPSPSEQNGS